MYSSIVDLITLLLSWLSDPVDESQVEEWISHAQDAVDLLEFTPCEHRIVERLLQMCKEQHLARIHAQDTPNTLNTPNTSNEPNEPNELNERSVTNLITVDDLLPPTNEVCYPDIPVNEEPSPIRDALQVEMDHLLQKEQIEQRTPEWYAQMATVLSASEIYKILTTPYQRGQMVLSKTRPPERRAQPLAVFSSHMSAFDWGIRFEPVVKQIYEDMYGATIKELGRLHHPTLPRCTASPDGLIYDSQRAPHTRGHLIEIKCPVTREVSASKIKPDYYAQMQMQMQVTGRPACEFVEAVFRSTYNQMELKDGPARYSGWIALVRRALPASRLPLEDEKEVVIMDEEMATASSRFIVDEFTYVYSPLHAPDSWVPDLENPMDEVVERIPWSLLQWSEQRVVRDEAWWATTREAMARFWEDVERAQRGEFDAPESSRPSKKAKTTTKADVSLFQFHRMDEDGNP